MEPFTKAEVPLGEQAWVRAFVGVLQFVGGGLAALHEEAAAMRVRGPENAEDREIRQRTADLGFATNQAETIRRAWAAAAPTSPTPRPTTVPTLSFEEFAAAAAAHLNAPRPAPSTPVDPPGPAPSTHPTTVAAPPPAPANVEPPPRRCMTLEEIVRSAPPARSSEAPSVAPALTPAPTADDTRKEVDPTEYALAARLVHLEMKFLEMQARLFAATQRDKFNDQQPAPSRETLVEPTASPKPDIAPTPPATTVAPDMVDTIGAQVPVQPRTHEDTTVVHGPWSGSREGPSTADKSADARAGEQTAIYDTHEQRVAALEKTLEQFGTMVEGLATRSRGPGPPTQ